MKTGLKLKVCGMRDLDNITEVQRVRPDYLGFIFYRPSPRFVGDDFVLGKEIGEAVPVGVFVNESTPMILRRLRQLGADHVQLHGDESPGQCEELRAEGIKVIKSLQMGDRFDPQASARYEKSVDYFLFDTKGKLYGGNARKFAWEILKDYNQAVPFFLSGGLTRENISGLDAMDSLNIWALDFNSGVEWSPGRKDPALVKTIKEMITT